MQRLPGLQLCPKLPVGAERQKAAAGLLGALLSLQLLPHGGRPGGVVLHLGPQETGRERGEGWLGGREAGSEAQPQPARIHSHIGVAVPGRSLR